MADGRRWMGWVGAGAAAAGLAAVGALLAVNVLLARAHSVSTEHVTVSWEAASMLLPLRVTVRGLEVDIHPHTTRVTVRADRVTAWLDPRSLLRRTIAVREVDATALALDIAEVGPKPADSLPPSGWALDLTVRDVAVERLTAIEWTLEGGAATLDGRLHVDLGRPAQVEAVTLDWRGASLRDRQAVLGESLDVAFAGSLRPGSGGPVVLGDVAGSLKASGRAVTLQPLTLLLSGADWLQALDGHGTVRVDATLRDGVLAEASTLHVDAEALRVGLLDLDVSGTGAVQGRVGADAIELDVDFAVVEAARRAQVVLRGAGVHLGVVIAGRELAAGPRRVQVAAQVPALEVPDVAALGAFLPRDGAVAITEGAAHVEGELHADTDGAVDARIALRGTGLSGRYHDLSLITSLAAEVRVDGGDLATGRLDVAAATVAWTDMQFTEVMRVRPDGESVERTFASSLRAEAADGLLVLASPVGLDLDTTLHLQDIRPLLAAAGQQRAVLDQLQGLLVARDVVADARVALVDGSFGITGLEASGGPLDLAAEVRVGPGGRDLLLWARYGPIGFGVRATPHDRTVRVVGAGGWYAAERQVFLAAHPFDGLR